MKRLFLFCMFLCAMYMYDAHSRVCFFGDPTCTQSDMNSTTIMKPEVMCRYYDKLSCEKANRNSYCDITKFECYYPKGCEVGYYKRGSDICSIATYSLFRDYDLFDCGKPVTVGGETCGEIGYGSTYSETGFDKKVQVFTESGNKIECYASSTKDKCDNSNPHGECVLDMCGNWHVGKCKEGSGYYWRAESGCLNGINYSSDEGVEICLECNICTYNTEEECLEENYHSKCLGIENCYNVEGCKDGFVSVDDNSEICKLGTYTKLFDIDNNGCGVPGTEGGGGGSPYFEAIGYGYDYPDHPGFKILSIARGNDFSDYSEIDSFDDWLDSQKEAAYDTQQNCERTTERGKRLCKSDECGYWIRSHSVCNEGYVIGYGFNPEECPEGYKRVGGYDASGCSECKCIHEDKLDCEKVNFHSVCEENENGCAVPVGCKNGYFKEEQNEEICKLGIYTEIFDKDDNGCGIADFGVRGSCMFHGYGGQLSEKNPDRQDVEVLLLGDWRLDSNGDSKITEFDPDNVNGQSCLASTTREKCESMNAICEQDKCGYWYVAKCKEGYKSEAFGGECPEGTDVKPGDDDTCYKCEIQCDYDTLEACHRENPNSVCKEGYEGATNCFNAEECLPYSYKESEAEKACKDTAFQYFRDIDKNGCGVPAADTPGYFGKDEYNGKEGFIKVYKPETTSVEQIRERGFFWRYEAGAFTSKKTCETSTIYGDFYCKEDMCGNWVHDYTECKKGFAQSDIGCPNGMVLNKDIEKTMDDRSKCYECVSKCEYKDLTACETENSNSVCEVDETDGCYKPMGCKEEDYLYAPIFTKTECPDKYVPSSDKDKNGCYQCERCYSETECEDEFFNSICDEISEAPGGEICYYAGMTCKEGYRLYHEGGSHRGFNCDYMGCCCDYRTKNECETENYNSVCKQLDKNCYGPVECKDGAKRYDYSGTKPSNTDANRCYFECKYKDLTACETENSHSVCEADELGCFMPTGCKAGWWKEDDESLCHSGNYKRAYHDFVDVDKNGCGLPVSNTLLTSEGDGCYYYGYYEETYSPLHLVQVFGPRNSVRIDSETGEAITTFVKNGAQSYCGAYDSETSCENDGYFVICEEDKCGNWYYTGCEEGYGNELFQPCPYGEETRGGSYICRKCKQCKYKDLTACETENYNSVCEMVDGCYKPMGCKNGHYMSCPEGYIEVSNADDNGCGKCIEKPLCVYENEEACENDNVHSVCEADELGCFVPTKCKSGYFKEEQNEEICKLGIYTEIFDKDDNGCGIPAYGDTWTTCFVRGYYEPILGKYPDGYVFKDLFIDESYAIESLKLPGKEFDPKILTSIAGCDVATSKEACENLNAVCEQDKCGYWRVEKCKEGYKRYNDKLDNIVDSNKTYMCYKDEPECEYASKKECENSNGNESSACEVDPADGCYKPMGCKEGWDNVTFTKTECPDKYAPSSEKDKNGCYQCERCYSKTECEERTFNSICDDTWEAPWGEICYDPSMKCKEGYTYYHTGSDVHVEETCDYNGCCCDYITLDACKKANYNSVCKKLNDECYGPVGCKDGATHITSNNDRPSNTDKNGCHFECDEEIQNICRGYSYPDEYPNSKCVTDEFNCKVLECKVGYMKKCSDGYVLDNIDKNGCGKCIKDEPVECEYKDKAACKNENFNSVCDMVDGCWKATKCNQWSNSCEEYCKNMECGLIDPDKNGCAGTIWCK